MQLKLENLSGMLSILSTQIPIDAKLLESNKKKSPAAFFFVRLMCRIAVMRVEVMARIYFGGDLVKGNYIGKQVRENRYHLLYASTNRSSPLLSSLFHNH